MDVQERAFHDYYASLADGDLLAMAANRTSFVEVAQRAMREELERRHLSLPEPPASAQAHHAGFFARVFHREHKAHA